MAPFEALIPASVADIWHVHERGFRMSIFNLGVLGGINLAGPIAGSVIQEGSYRIAMHGMGGAFVLMLLLVIFFMPESAFARQGVLNIDTSDKTIAVEKSEKEAVEQIEDRPRTISMSEPRITYVKELMPWSGYWDHVSFWRTLLRPFFMIVSPIVMWATLLFTICISWLVLISITLSQIFSAPPYNFSVSAVGATNVSSFVASVLATMVAGPIIDGVATYMSKRNHGIFGQFVPLHNLTLPLTLYSRTRIPPPSDDNLPHLHGYWLLRMGRIALQARPLAHTRHRLHGSHQPRRSTWHYIRGNIRQ